MEWDEFVWDDDEKDEFLNISITSGTTKIQQTLFPTQRCSIQSQSDSYSLSLGSLKMINSTQFWSQPTCWLNRDDGKVQEQQRLFLTLVPAVDFCCVFFFILLQMIRACQVFVSFKLNFWDAELSAAKLKGEKEKYENET